jgi:hypothetical protein
MKGISKSMTVAVVLLVLITIGGAVGWYWVANQIDGLQSQQDGVRGDIASLEKKVYSPVAGNLALLKKSEEELQELLDDFKDELQLRDKVYDTVRVTSAEGVQKGLDPDAWKKMFGSIRDRLTKEAADAKVKIPQDYDFTFSAYRLSLPADNLTLPLGVQLLGVEKISDILIGAKVQSVNFIKRTDVGMSRAGSTGKENADLFVASVLEGPGGLYKVYPFNIAFTCSPTAFSKVVDKLESSELLFIIRDISIENEKQAIPLASQVKAATAGGSNSSDNPPVVGKAISKLVMPVLGQELIQANMRVDLLYLTLHAPSVAPKAGSNPNAKQGNKL